MLTSGNFGLYSNTYTVSQLANGTGLIPGRLENEPNSGNFKQLVFNNTGSTLANNAALSFVAAEASDYSVGLADTDTDASLCVGVNDNAGAAIPDQTYFWMSTKGFVTVNVNAGVAAGALVAPSSTGGSLGAAGTTQQTNIQLLEASGGGGATSALII